MVDVFAARSVPLGASELHGWAPSPDLWGALDPPQRRSWAHQHRKDSHWLAVQRDDLDPEAVRASEADRWLLKAMDFGNGHKEAVVVRQYPDPWRTADRALDRVLGPAERGESEDREGNIERAVRRAKKSVRHTCKALGVNSLWTLTYRENVTDRELVLRHLDRFRRAVQKVLPGWVYVAVLERQERGAWHVHLATRALAAHITQKGVKLKSWDVMRGIWRGITRELGGNFDEAKRTTRWGGGRKRRFKGAAGIATYIGGYVAKDMMSGELNRKRFSRSAGVELPTPLRREFEAHVALRDLIALAYEHVGQRITTAWFDPGRECFFIASDDSGGVG